LNRDQPQKDDVDDPREVPIRRKDSLLRAQELTASTTFDKANRRHSIPKNFLQDEPARIDLEKRLAEALQREEELSRENIRLEKNLKDARAELDKVQSEARSTKYSSSEQASRIKELERKLKNEKERYEELERERDAMKDEYEQDLEDQKDINRQLEQMVMSEEFEKELEDEINQVKELEHANRRFKVKIDSK
jgi:chromosome segregation ATPase